MNTENTEQSEERRTDTQDRVQALVMCKFLGTPDDEFSAFIEQMPETHWAKYDLSAVRLGWEAAKVFCK